MCLSWSQVPEVHGVVVDSDSATFVQPLGAVEARSATTEGFRRGEPTGATLAGNHQFF